MILHDDHIIIGTANEYLKFCNRARDAGIADDAFGRASHAGALGYKLEILSPEAHLMIKLVFADELKYG